MRFTKPLVAAALAFSMCGTPILAQSAAPLSVAARSGADTKDSNRLFESNSYLLPALVIVAVLAAAILISNSQGDNNPSSP